VGKSKPLLCVLGFVPTTKEGFTFCVLAFASHLDSNGLDFGALASCLPFAPYHNFNNGCFIDFLILF
jgi:hypothetical protein